MPAEWFSTAKDATEKKRKAEEEPDGSRRLARQSTAEQNNNQRLGDNAQGIGDRGGGGGGGDDDDDVEESADEESQESGAEEALKRSWKRSKAGHARHPDHDPDWVEARIPKDILNDIMPVAVKEGLSVRQTVVILAAMLTSAGVDLEQINMSRSTCHRRLVDTSETVGDNGLNDYIEEVQKKSLGVVCHFDGKIMQEDFNQRRESKSRLVLLLNSPWLAGERLLGVAPLEVESGYAIALQVYDRLLHLEVEDKVIGAVFDSTGVNTGEEEGASIHLQRLLDRPILEVECTHHQQVLD